MRHLLVTRRRVLLTSGVIIRTVAVMPLRRITDLTWKETFWGQVFDYGTFRFESAGQQQGLDVIAYMPHADALYKRLSELMFGTTPHQPGQRRRGRRRVDGRRRPGGRRGSRAAHAPPLHPGGGTTPRRSRAPDPAAGPSRRLSDLRGGGRGTAG